MEPKLTKHCYCGVEGELKQFATFSYYFCPQCKDEIKDTIPTQIGKDVGNTRAPKFAGEMTFEEWSHALSDMFSGGEFKLMFTSFWSSAYFSHLCPDGITRCDVMGYDRNSKSGLIGRGCKCGYTYSASKPIQEWRRT